MTALIDDFLITRMYNFDLEKSNLIPVKKVVNISTTRFYFDFLNFHKTLNFIILIETELEPFTVKFKIPGYFEIQFIALS